MVSFLQGAIRRGDRGPYLCRLRKKPAIGWLPKKVRRPGNAADGLFTKSSNFDVNPQRLAEVIIIKRPGGIKNNFLTPEGACRHFRKEEGSPGRTVRPAFRVKMNLGLPSARRNEGRFRNISGF
jgi:hypothetical protein